MEGQELTKGLSDLPPEVIQEVRDTLAKMLKGEFTRFDVFAGPIKDNTGKELVPAGEKLTQADLDQFPPGAPGLECKYCMRWWADGITAELPAPVAGEQGEQGDRGEQDEPSAPLTLSPCHPFRNGAAMSEPINVSRRMRGITKRFPGVLANDQVDFELRRGEVHALLGENGAGKSTLMNILAGLYRHDSGTIHVHGQPASFGSPRDAISAGIGMIHQHFMLVPSQTVTENILIGLAQPRFRLRLAKYEQQVAELSERFGLKVDPRARIWQLSVGEQQRVEILKMLYRGADILVMDEPTAVLAPHEIEGLVATLRAMAAEGKSIIFISHKLQEVMAIADRVTVLRRGRVTAAGLPTAGSSTAELARLMVGREVLFRIEKPPAEPGAVALAIEDVVAENDRGLPALRGLSAAGARWRDRRPGGRGGQRAARAGRGDRRAAALHKRHGAAGRRDDQQPARAHGHPQRACLCARGSDARGQRAKPEHHRQPDHEMLRPPAGRPGLARRCGGGRSLRRAAQGELRHPDALAAHPGAAALGRQPPAAHPGARDRHPATQCMLAMQPTQGLDVGAIETVHRLLLEQRAAGVAILLISEELEELLALSDRICVIYEGKIVGEVDDHDMERLGLMMTGSAKMTR